MPYKYRRCAPAAFFLSLMRSRLVEYKISLQKIDSELNILVFLVALAKDAIEVYCRGKEITFYYTL
jgi:hypothetical protein